MPTRNGHAAPALSAANGKGQVRLLTRHNLDGRTKARRDFESIVRAVASDISGGDESRISTIQWGLIEAYTSAKTVLDDFNARRMLGQQIDLLELCQTITTLVRVASRLPRERVAKDITTLGSLIRADQDAVRLARQQQDQAQPQPATNGHAQQHDEAAS
jgi:hypothetical protein